MRNSFFVNAKDADLVNSSANFSLKITDDPLMYGLSAADAAAYSALNTAYQQAYQTAITPETRTKAAVRNKDDAKAALCKKASLLSKKIDGTEGVTDAQKIDLGLATGTKPSPVSDPGLAYDFTATLNPDGSLKSNWKCKNGRGVTNVMYQVYRRTSATGVPVALGMTGKREFVDTTIPPGATQVMYQVQAVRSTGAGPWATFMVTFGSNGMTLSTEDQPAKRAA